MFFLSKMIAIINPFCCCCWFWLFTNTHTFTSYDNRIELNWIQFNLILWWAIILTTLASIDNIDQIPYRMIRILCVCVYVFLFIQQGENELLSKFYCIYSIELNCMFVCLKRMKGKKTTETFMLLSWNEIGIHHTHTHNRISFAK